MDKMLVGKKISIKAMRSGLVDYGNDMILVDNDALSRMCSSSIGIPVIIEHPNQKLDKDNFKNVPVVGRVIGMSQPMGDDWYIDFIVDTEEAVDLLNSGWGVSTAWIGEQYEGSGTYNSLPYDRKLIEGRYEHLAIVDNPRYEMARNPVFLNSVDTQKVDNSPNNGTITSKAIKKEGLRMLKIFKKVFSKEEVKYNSSEEKPYVNIDGKDISLEEMINAIEGKTGEESISKKMLNEDDTISYNDSEISVKDLVAKYNECMIANKNAADEEEAKKNAEAEEAEAKKKEEEEEKAKKNANTEEEAKKNAEAEEAKAKEEEEEAKKNAQNEQVHFNSLANAHSMSGSDTIEMPTYMSLVDRVALGKELYGKK